MRKVFLNSLTDGYDKPLAEGLDWCGILSGIKRSTTVCIKPNLTFPEFRKGVMTNPHAIESLIVCLKDHTDHIIVCEADSGGYNRFSINEVFETTGLTSMSKKYNIRLVNLSFESSRPIVIDRGGKKLFVPIANLLLDEVDLFITMPVPKIHMNTKVSLSVKNQWGLIQIPSERLKLHPYFKEVIYAVNKGLPRTVSVIDGRYGLTRSGPMRGDVVDLNWILIANDIFAADYVACNLMRIDPMVVPHLRYVLEKENIFDISTIEFNRDYREFVSRDRFYLRHEWTDIPGQLAFNSRFLAYLGYESPIAGFLHWLLYLFREPFYDYESNRTSLTGRNR